ncbi:hypothetical protein [Clostridium hydrogeniformans]|uniref:hypothetical protein n=1 Tax=Clostridium hydrogeniformans TaxID=349933 RepID=UPI0004804E94|nr:hypothetical protein [Clostridium hydrogeniformans]
MYEISYSKEKNRIYIKISEDLCDAEEKKYIDDMIHCLNNVRPNFTVCANLKSCGISVLHNSGSFEVVRNYGREKKIYKVAIVLNNEIFNANLANSFNKLNDTFKNIEDAEKYLDS